MPSSAGPNTAGESNLVFAYDTGDTVNSYKGEPATNYHDYDKSVMNQTGFNNWSCYDGSPPYHTWGNNQSRTFVTLPGPDGKDTPAMLYHNFNGGFYGPTDWGGIPAAICTSGNQITIQGWVKAADAASVGLVVTPYTYFSLNNGGVEATSTNWTLTANWQLISHTHTLSSAGTNNNAILYFFTSNGSSPVRMYLTKTGVISGKGHAVQWLPGGTTRSVSGSLVPAVGTNAVNVSNTSFTSNAQMTFDGTNDYVTITNTPSLVPTSTTSWEFIVQPTSTSGYRALFQKANYGNSTGFISLFMNPSGLYFRINASDVAEATRGLNHYFGINLTLNAYAHVVLTYDGLIFRLYINGVADTTAAWSYGLGTNQEDLLVGTFWAGSWAGNIPVAKQYNKTLSAAEIQQNYQVYKTRFNLA